MTKNTLNFPKEGLNYPKIILKITKIEEKSVSNGLICY